MSNIHTLNSRRDDNTARPTRKLPAGVTIFSGGNFMIHFGKDKPTFGATPEFISSMLDENAPSPQSSSNVREELILQLGLTDETILALDAIAEENDLNFVEAITFHLSMTL